MEKKEHTEDVRKRFVKALKKLNVDIDDSTFAKRVGIYQQNVSKIKNGQRYPTVETLVNLCVEFGVNPAWILLGRGDMFVKDSSLEKSALDRLNRLEKTVKEMNAGKLKKSA
jgi:transcriptional regulator with XRE-family HTH domain